MCTPKTKRRELAPPAYVLEEWKKGDKNAMAQLLEKVNFDKDSQYNFIHEPSWIIAFTLNVR